jgi:hypothetical protein
VEFTYQKVVKLVVEFLNQKGGLSVVEFTYKKVKLVVEFLTKKAALPFWISQTKICLACRLWNPQTVEQ